MSILLLDKINFRVKKIVKDRLGHSKTLKGSTYQEGIAILNIYAQNKRPCKICEAKIDRTERRNR